MKDIAKRLATYNATFLGQKTFLDTLFFLYHCYIIDIMILKIKSLLCEMYGYERELIHGN